MLELEGTCWTTKWTTHSRALALSKSGLPSYTGNMRSRFIAWLLFVAMVAVGCSQSESPQALKGATSTAQDDQRVIETVLLDFLAYQGEDLGHFGDGSKILLGRLSSEKVGMVTPDQLNQGLRKNRVPDELVQALYNRNKKRGGADFAAVQTDFGSYTFNKKIKVVDMLPHYLECGTFLRH